MTNNLVELAVPVTPDLGSRPTWSKDHGRTTSTGWRPPTGIHVRCSYCGLINL
ncbi:hypothetical protein BDV11DRAFT_187015, partial [Aspergillus similis]